MSIHEYYFGMNKSYDLLVVAMETKFEAIFPIWLSWKQCHTCIPSFITISLTTGKFEKLRSNLKVNALRQFFEGGCHANSGKHSRTKFHLHVCYLLV